MKPGLASLRVLGMLAAYGLAAFAWFLVLAAFWLVLS